MHPLTSALSGEVAMRSALAATEGAVALRERQVVVVVVVVVVPEGVRGILLAWRR